MVRPIVDGKEAGYYILDAGAGGLAINKKGGTESTSDLDWW